MWAGLEPAIDDPLLRKRAGADDSADSVKLGLPTEGAIFGRDSGAKGVGSGEEPARPGIRNRLHRVLDVGGRRWLPITVTGQATGSVPLCVRSVSVGVIDCAGADRAAEIEPGCDIAAETLAGH